MVHVLIIEDDPLIAMNLQLLLEENGATSTMIVATQDEAIDAARLRRPAFITADVGLATGTGPAAVAAIHRAHGWIPVIFITVQPDAEDRLARTGEVFGKPVNERAIANAFKTKMAA